MTDEQMVVCPACDGDCGGPPPRPWCRLCDGTGEVTHETAESYEDDKRGGDLQD
jgi:DnaJ-class molecular chaperone